MSLLHKESYECVVSDLDLTATPPTQTSVEDASIVEHNPIHSLTHGGPIEFLSLGSSTHYRDLSDMHLALKCRVKKNKTEDLDDKCKVAVINYLLNTLFCQVDIFLAEKKLLRRLQRMRGVQFLRYCLISVKMQNQHIWKRRVIKKIRQEKWIV